MRVARRFAAAALLCFALAAQAEPPAEPAAAEKPRVPEPNVQRTVIDDDMNHVEELNVRGQPRSAVVTTKGALASTYEIHIGDPSRDTGSGAGRGVVGQRMWRVFQF